MAGAKVPAPLDPMVNGDDWTNILARLEKTYKGYDGVSLTNWAAGNTTRPKIAAGSVIEIDGAPFEYPADEPIVDGAGLKDGWCYIKHVVSGDAVTPTLTNTFGTWDTAKQGFYDGDDRFSLFKMYRSGAITKIFTLKQELIKTANNILVGVNVDGSISKRKRIKWAGSGQLESVVFGLMEQDIPNIGDQILLNGVGRYAIPYNDVLDIYSIIEMRFMYAERLDNNTIRILSYDGNAFRNTKNTAEMRYYQLFQNTLASGFLKTIRRTGGQTLWMRTLGTAGSLVGDETNTRFTIAWESNETNI